MVLQGEWSVPDQVLQRQPGKGKDPEGGYGAPPDADRPMAEEPTSEEPSGEVG